MNEQIRGLIQEVLDLAARADATPHTIHAKGIEAKQAIWDEYDSLVVSVNML